MLHTKSAKMSLSFLYYGIGQTMWIRLIYCFTFISSFLFLSAALISCTTLPKPNTAAKTNSYQVVNVNLIDVINKTVHPNTTVIVKNGVISDIYSSDKNTNSTHHLTDIRTIDGAGKYLIPGLWDNHSTLLSFSAEVDFPLYIANGITSIRSNLSCPNEKENSLYACMSQKAKWQQEITAGKLLGPSLQGWGTFPINGKSKIHPDLPNFHAGRTIENAQLAVEHYANYPHDDRPYFLKTYNWIPKEAYFALNKYAQENGFEISGHLPREVTIEEAIEAGQRSIAHARLFTYNCSNIADEFRIRGKKLPPLTLLYPKLIKSFDAELCQQKYQHMAKHEIFINPTLMTRRNDYYGVAGMFDKMQGLEYAHYLIALEWEEDIGVHGEDLSAQDIKAFKDLYQLTASTIAQAQKAGVTILAGSDSWSEYNVPGFSLHEELQAMSEAGIDNYSILQAATINGAKYFRKEKTIGSIDIGKQADLVLLSANPVTDIKNTQAVDTVFKGSQVYEKSALDKMKADVKELANSHLLAAKIVLDIM